MKMGSIVGFTLHRDLSPEDIVRAVSTENRALSHFKHLETHSLNIGSSRLSVWGHASVKECIHTLRDGSTLVLIGSPHNTVPWQEVETRLLGAPRPEEFDLPWEGRLVLLQISADGGWTMWNDWLGSIPVYHAQPGHGRIASTLEPVAVSAAGSTPDDVYLPGLVSLLLNGFFLSDWTLYRNVKAVLHDSVAHWDENGFRATRVWSVRPSRDRWDASWDDLVDEMHALSYKAIAGALKNSPAWVLPLSSGLDSRLIAAVAADVGANANAYAWGAPDNTDAHYSRELAQALGLPWKNITFPNDFLVNYTPQWASWMGTALHFQGMYLMNFLDQIRNEPAGPVINGYVGDVLSGSLMHFMVKFHTLQKSYHVHEEWHSNWGVDQLRAVARFPLEDALEENRAYLQDQLNNNPGTVAQNIQLLRLWTRQRRFTGFLPILKDYWRGVATPFMDRSYARFCLSIPRSALDYRRLLAEVFKRYYTRLAMIPGSYGSDPYIPTGRYLLQKRIAKALPPALRRRVLKGFGNVDVCMDFKPIQTLGKASVWPLFEMQPHLSEWFDMEKVEEDFHTIVKSDQDPRPLRRLQAVQTFAAAFLPKT